jgi:hypothetical protein
MRAPTRPLVLGASAVLALGVVTGIATAGNPHGTPPGQAQQQQQQQQSSTSQTSTTTQTTTTTPTTTVQTGGSNAQGVKPSSTTSHDTYATAGSGHTKQYGNGKTAGQIAEQNGASSSTVLHGPGNSQPHKAAPCGGGHERDVHALKAGAGACGQTQQTSTPQTTHHESAQHTTAQTTSTQQTTTVQTTTPQTTTTSTRRVVTRPARPTGGVLGAQARLTPVTRSAPPAHAVVGTAHFTG